MVAALRKGRCDRQVQDLGGGRKRGWYGWPGQQPDQVSCVAMQFGLHGMASKGRWCCSG